MLKFTYTATINELPIDDDKKFFERLTGVIEAEDYAHAKKQAQSLAFARREQLERERGDIYGYENVQVELSTVPAEKAVITPEMYQKSALRTLYSDLTRDQRLGLCGLGLPAEIGEVLDMLKKYLYHRNGKPLDIEKIKDELGDVMWYFFILLDTVGITFEEVLQANVTKLEERHPNGFTPHYVSDSHASEVSQ